ncbi:hypothetical protein LCGC14_2428500 [marine sediment metagenome]|uniref:Uncharacterized protein n=1 Tax=marine sediment metagenome TaxID=412755 RepID=A0A0F9BMN8_9ZZZZ
MKGIKNYLAEKVVEARNNSRKATVIINRIKSKKNWANYEYWRKKQEKWMRIYYWYIRIFNLKDIVKARLIRI